MSRPPRFSYAHAVHHVTLRCNNREFLFDTDSFELFVAILQEARGRFPLSLYNYCLMTNHVHLLFKVGRDDTLSKAMHWLSTTFVRRFNSTRGRKGHLWEGRFRSTIIEEATSFFRCMAYVDLNPVRAQMAAAPGDYQWGGHRALRAEDSAHLDMSSLYLETAPDAATRYSIYAELLAEEALRERFSLATAHFLGSPRFVSRMVTRFGLGERAAGLERRSLGTGLVCLGPRHGGERGPK